MCMENDNWHNLKVIYAGICGSDINKVRSNRVNDNQLPCLGHEIVCLAEDGRYYIVNPFICSTNCVQCNQASLIYCDKVLQIGSGSIPSGFSGRICVPTRNMFQIPPNIQPEVGILTDGIAVVLHALHLVNMVNLRRVAVIGAGSIGVLFALVLKEKYGDVQIDIVARKAKQHFLTTHYGDMFRPVDSISSLGDSYDIIVEAVGGNQTQTLTQAIEAAQVNGMLLVLGAFDESCSTIDGLRTLFYKQLTVIGANSFCVCHDDFANAVSWTFENEKILLPLITNRYVVQRSQLSPSRIRQAIMKSKIMKGCIVHEA